MDIRRQLRFLGRQPGFTSAVTLTLALGIGANTAMFSVVNGVLLRSLPYSDPGRLIRVIQNTFEIPPTPVRTPVMSREDFKAIRETAELIEAAAYDAHPDTGSLTQERLTVQLGGREEPIPFVGAKVSPELFPLLGARPLFGRVFEVQEETPGAEYVVILSYGAWLKYFDGDREILGRTVMLDRIAHSVVGVMNQGFEFPGAPAEFWIPLSDSNSRNNQVIARLKDGVSIEAANAEVEALLRQRDEAGLTDFAEINDSIERRAELVPMKDELVAPVRPAFRILFAAVGFVLLIACANVTNLLLVRAAAQRREIAIRGALGAGRGQLVRQVLTESVLLGLAGGIAGIVFALCSLQVVRRLGAGGIPRLEEVGIDFSVLAFTLAISFLTGVIFGVAPALRVARADPMDVIREGAGAASSGLGIRGRYHSLSFLVVSEIAIVTLLLVGAGLSIRSFMNLMNVDSGFDSRNVLTFRIAAPFGRYPDLRAFQLGLIERLKLLPGVQYAGTIETLPIAAEAGGWFTYLQGTPLATGQQLIRMRFISQDYLPAMGIRVLEGRGFRDNDRDGQPAVMLISRAFARRYFAGQNPIGRLISCCPPLFSGQGGEVVGVVDDVREVGLGVEPEPEIYLDIRQLLRQSSNRVSFAIRTSGPLAAIGPEVRSLVRQMDPALMLESVSSMDDIVYRSVARPRFYAALSGIFGVTALLLAAIGIYGVISYSVTQRTREIGIRMALGAQPRQVLALVLKQGIAVTIAGLSLGLAGALAVSRYVESMLFGMTSFDPPTFAVVAAIFVVVALLSCYFPARRATKIDPMVVLHRI